MIFRVLTPREIGRGGIVLPSDAGAKLGQGRRVELQTSVVALEVDGGLAPCVVDTPATCTAEDTHDIHIMPQELVTETRFRIGDVRYLA